MNVIDAVMSRISTRAFKNEELSVDEVKEILEIARYSPSSSNFQPWKTIVVAGAERERVSEIATQLLLADKANEDDEYPVYPEELPEKYQERRALVAEDIYTRQGIARSDLAGRKQFLVDQYNFYGAPVGIFFCIERIHDVNQWASLGMFMQTVCLVAREKGYATCMQEMWAFVRKSLHSHFELDPGEVIFAGMSLGRADESNAVNQIRTAREAVDDFSRFVGF